MNSNRAVAFRVALAVSSQTTSIPLQSPLHLTNLYPEAGTAVSTTTVPSSNVPVHSSPTQVSPDGVEVTAPSKPVGSSATLMRCCRGMKRAVTSVSESTSMLQPCSPEHPPPDHPANVELASGVAVSVTEVPPSKTAEHVLPQSMPAGDDETA